MIEKRPGAFAPGRFVTGRIASGQFSALVVTVMSCLLPPKSSTRAALPSGVRAGLSSVSSTTTLLSLVHPPQG